MLILHFVMGLCAIREIGVEAVNIFFEDAKILEVDQEYFDPKKSELRVDEDEETGETSLAMVFSVIKMAPADTAVSRMDYEDIVCIDKTSLRTFLFYMIVKLCQLQLHVAFMKFSMGRYTIPTGIDVTLSLCDAIVEPILAAPAFAALGWTKEQCPPLPGFYSTEGYQPPSDLLPDEFVENKYVGHYEVFTKNKTLLRYDIYAYVQDG